MTLAAIQSSVFPLQRVAGSIVIESFQRRNPADELKILAIVLGVALPAVFFVWMAGVQPASLRNPLRNLCVTLAALQGCRACSDSVATDTLCWPAEGLVRFGKRSR